MVQHGSSHVEAMLKPCSSHDQAMLSHVQAMFGSFSVSSRHIQAMSKPLQTMLVPCPNHVLRVTRLPSGTQGKRRDREADLLKGEVLVFVDPTSSMGWARCHDDVLFCIRLAVQKQGWSFSGPKRKVLTRSEDTNTANN